MTEPSIGRISRFRSDRIRTLFRTAVAQGFQPGHFHGSGHAYLDCPKCGGRIVFSTTCNGNGSKTRNAVAELRRHGFAWQGRPATHTAESTRKRT